MFRQWCGNAQGQTAPLEDRLLEFATELWGNSAFQLMMQSIFCDPRFELCHADLVVSAPCSTRRFGTDPT